MVCNPSNKYLITTWNLKLKWYFIVFRPNTSSHTPSNMFIPHSHTPLPEFSSLPIAILLTCMMLVWKSSSSCHLHSNTVTHTLHHSITLRNVSNIVIITMWFIWFHSFPMCKVTIFPTWISNEVMEGHCCCHNLYPFLQLVLGMFSV